jgi:hypothetical protein
MTVPTKITDHETRALDDLLSQFDNSPKLRELVSIIAGQVQLLENIGYELLVERTLDNAEGVQLDILGKIAGGIASTRGSFGDEEYRKLIGVAIRINNSDGRAEDTIEIIAALVGTTVDYFQHHKAHYELNWELATPSSDDWLRKIEEQMPRITISGVSWSTSEGSDTAFRFGVAGRGFGQGELGKRTDVI